MLGNYHASVLEYNTTTCMVSVDLRASEFDDTGTDFLDMFPRPDQQRPDLLPNNSFSLCNCDLYFLGLPHSFF